MTEAAGDRVLPFSLRLLLVLGDAAVDGRLSWQEADRVDVVVSRWSCLAENSKWAVYVALGPR
jgi:hypothetical protein